MSEVIFKEESYQIQGAVFEVYREMGCGFLEAVYQECLERELKQRGIPFESQKELKISYKNENLRQIYRPDLICYGKIVVELKAVRALAPEHKAQLFNYLRATDLELGILVNFGHYPMAQVVRIVI